MKLNSSLLLVLILALAFSSLASAQATRTWVSGVGDDANPCSRTAPCKTFAGAISKTAPGGIIDCLDPGGFGAVTITKSIMIDCDSGPGGILVAGTNGIIINAATTDNITLRSINFDGTGTGLDGIKILQAGNVHLEDLKIVNFAQNGVEVAATASVNLTIYDCTITETSLAGILVATSAGTASVDVKNLHSYDTHPGITGGANSAITVTDSDFSTGAKGIKQVAASSSISVANSQLSSFTVDALESFAGATIRASGNTLSQNALAVNPNGGTISSDGTNVPLGNTSNGSFNGLAISKF